LCATDQTDEEIAKQVGCTKMNVAAYRRKHGIMRWRWGRKVKIDFGKMADLYQSGKNDREIAEGLGCSDASVNNWRKKNGLPCQANLVNGCDVS
jgi:DNA-binding CsgD family transcriptional regulator